MQQQQQQKQQQQQGSSEPPNPTQGQQQAQAAVAAAASAQQMAAAASAQQAAALAAMLPSAAAAGGARPTALSLHPALAAINPSLAAAGMLPVAGPAGTFTFAARPGMQQPFFYPAVPQPVASVGPSASAAAAAAARRPASRPGSRSSSAAAAGKKHCNCKNSRCLKLYCECFASGRYCDGCNCINCYNNREHEATRQSAVEAILERNPNAFRPKIAGGPDSRRSGGARHNKGCNCKKSGCLKKYCECFQAGIVCSEICKCLDCKNYEGSEARDALVSPPQSERPGSPMGLRRTARTISPAAAAAAPSARLGFTPPNTGSAGFPGLAQLQQAHAAAAAQLAAAHAAAAGPKPLTAEHEQVLAREAVREVIKPEVVEKLAMLLMVVSQEEYDRRQQSQLAPLEADQAVAMDVDAQQQPAAQQQQRPAALSPNKRRQQQQAKAAVGVQPVKQESDSMEVDGDAAVPAAGSEPAAAMQRQHASTGQPSPPATTNGATGMADAAGDGGGAALAIGAVSTGQQQEEESLYDAQERLVLTEFRDTLQMICRVVGEKVEKKTLAAQQQHQQQGVAGLLGMGLPQLKPAQAAPAGSTGMFMAAPSPGQPQLVLLPQALMAQQLAAAGGGQQLAGATLLMQPTPRTLHPAVKQEPSSVMAGASGSTAAATATPQCEQQQQEAAASTAANANGTT